MTIALLRSTGSWWADYALQLTLTRLDAAFPDRIRSCYLSGSFADGSARAASDIDGLVIFKGELRPGERERFQQVTRRCSFQISTLMDLAVRGEEELYREGEVPAKTAARVLLHGEDVGDKIPPLPAKLYAQLIVQGSLFYVGLVRGRSDALAFPLDYPDPDGEFYGYERRGYRDLAGWRRSGTKAIVGGTTLAATALVAMRTGCCSVRQGDSVRAYRRLIDDDWADLIEDIYESCRLKWSYAVPAGPADREHLRDLCRRLLGFENDYLLACKRYLLNCLQGADARSRRMARQTFKRVTYPDDEVTKALVRAP